MPTLEEMRQQVVRHVNRALGRPAEEAPLIVTTSNVEDRVADLTLDAVARVVAETATTTVAAGELARVAMATQAAANGWDEEFHRQLERLRQVNYARGLHRNEAERVIDYEQRDRASAKAMNLLFACLSPAQRLTYQERRQIVVDGQYYRYVINCSGITGNVLAVDADGSSRMAICFYPENAHDLPFEDVYAAQKLSLESRERETLDAAHKWGEERLNLLARSQKEYLDYGWLAAHRERIRRDAMRREAACVPVDVRVRVMVDGVRVDTDIIDVTTLGDRTRQFAVVGRRTYTVDGPE